jgi:cytochrome c oxidase accessory protein FixG
MTQMHPPGRLQPAVQAPLYATRQRVYPKAVDGTVRRWKWVVLVLCLTAYYLVPWLRWDRGPGAPNQAVLVDIEHGRLFFFFIQIWPQEVYFLTGLLVLAAISLFVATSLFGRVWCGFACPQTVWTDLFMWVERQIQGDRNERMRLDKAPWTFNKLRKKGATHAAWLLIAAATGGAWIMYFNDAPTVVRDVLTAQASVEVYFFFALFTGTTYLLAGWAREQVCTYMCPWPRFQAAMLDENSLVVTYRDWRGEPRGKATKQGIGDCVDCRACVNVCPTGIDIRDGQQLECIGCGLCIDACDDIMQRLDRRKGLVAFETLANLSAAKAEAAALPPGPARHDAGMAARKPPRFLRPRTLLYGVMLMAVASVMAGALLTRQEVTLSVLRDRAPLFIALADGSIRNAYTIKIANKTRSISELALDVEAAVPVQVQVQEGRSLGGNRFAVTTRPDGITQWRVLVTQPAGPSQRASSDIVFRLRDGQGNVVASERSVLLGPKP